MQVPAGSGAPVGTFIHAPIVAGSAHERQGPEHAVAQHTPCAQMSDRQSARFEHSAPLGFLPHELPVQTLPGEQFASIVQASKHCAPLQANGTQAMVSGATQAPVALQVDSGENTLFSQCAGEQTVPGRWRRQAPAPSHVPSVPHDSAGCNVHVRCGSSEPADTGVQTPGAEGSAQLRQAPWQLSAQQTPSTQKLLRHSAVAEQGWPLVFLPQLPSSQARPSTHSALLVQALMHAFSEQ